MKAMRACCGISMISAVSLVAPAAATTYVVTPDGTGDFPTIQTAIDAAEDGDIIELTAGTFTGNGNRDIDYLGKAITVRSQSGNPDVCIIDCEGQRTDPHRGFTLSSGEGPASVLEGVTITNGWFDGGSGGGMYCDGSSPTVTNCTFLGNLAGGRLGGVGGGMYCGPGSSPTLTDCRFLGNGASGVNCSGIGGGMYCAFGSSPTLNSCTFSENSACARAGGMYCASGSSPTLTDCTFFGNSAPGWLDFGTVGRGGGMVCRTSSLTLTNCTFSDNSSQEGGGIYCFNSSPTITDCTFSDNEACCGIGAGGGMYFSGGSPTITNCTMSGNSSQEGGGICCFNSSPTITNTIIAFSEDGEAIYCVDAESQPILNCCDVYGNEGGDWVDCIADQLGVNGNFSADPLFCDIVNGDLTLDANSPLLPGNHPNGHDCGLIGAWGEGCGATPVLETTWGAIKAQFRE